MHFLRLGYKKSFQVAALVLIPYLLAALESQLPRCEMCYTEKLVWQGIEGANQ